MSNLIIVVVLVIAILCGVHVEHRSAPGVPPILVKTVRIDRWSLNVGSHDWTVWETRSYE